MSLPIPREYLTHRPCGLARLKHANNEDEPKQGVVRYIPVTPLRGEQ